MKLREYSISLLEKDPEYGPVWVKNSSKGERRGNVVITVARQSGIGSDAVAVPPTWIPIDITSTVSRLNLLKDNQFRQSLNVGLLTLIHPEDAEKLFETDLSARQEQQRIRNMNLSNGAESQQDASQSSVEVFSDPNSGNNGQYPAPLVAMISLLERAVLNSELTSEMEDEAVVKLRGSGEMSEATYKWVWSKTITIAPKVGKVAKMLGREAKERDSQGQSSINGETFES